MFIISKDYSCVATIEAVFSEVLFSDVASLEEVSSGDDVYIWDNENITVEEIAKACGTINYEIICTVSYRVPRVFVK